MLVVEVVKLYLQHTSIEGVHCEAARTERVRTLSDFAAAHPDLEVGEARPFHLTDWIAAHPGWRSVSTRRARANMVRACFQWATDQERINRNPFRAVRYPEAERRPDMPDQTLERIARLANKRFEEALRFLRLTGCRLSELCRAEWPDVDLDRGIWVIHRHKSRKHTGKAKVVALTDEACALLRRIGRDRLFAMAPAGAVDQPAVGVPLLGASTAEKGSTLPTSGIIFLNTAGTPWTRRTLGQQLIRLKRRHGINEKASLHGIRHRFGSAAVINGAPLKLVAAQLGHSTVGVTERYYVCLDGEIDAIRAAAALGKPR